MKKQIFTFALAAFAMSIFAQDIKLPQPVKTGGKPLMEALNNRKSQRTFADKELSQQQLSNLLWAASGVNREESGRMTAPTASDNRQVEVFVALKTGVYQYLPKTNELKLQMKGDLRHLFARQAAHAKAPVLLGFISNHDKMGKYDDAAKQKYSSTDVGNVSQNVYLYCASENLSTVVMGNFDATALAKGIKLTNGQKPILTQAVGFSK